MKIKAFPKAKIKETRKKKMEENKITGPSTPTHTTYMVQYARQCIIIDKSVNERIHEIPMTDFDSEQ